MRKFVPTRTLAPGQVSVKGYVQVAVIKYNDAHGPIVIVTEFADVQQFIPPPTRGRCHRFRDARTAFAYTSVALQLGRSMLRACGA